MHLRDSVGFSPQGAFLSGGEKVYRPELCPWPWLKGKKGGWFSTESVKGPLQCGSRVRKLVDIAPLQFGSGVEVTVFLSQKDTVLQSGEASLP